MTISFADVEKLPDGVNVQLPDGSVIPLGDIRAAAKEHVDTTINKRISDLTPREQKIAAREKAVEEEAKRVREAMVALANTPPSTPSPPVNPAEMPPLGYTPERWAAIKEDPFARPLVEAAAMLAMKTEQLEKQLADARTEWQKSQESRRQQEEQNWILWQRQKLAEQDPRYKDDAEWQGLLDFGKEVLTRRDMTVLDRARNYENRLKEAKEEAYQRGLKEGTAKAPVPSVPYGGRAVPVPPAPEKLPPTFNEFADAAAADNDLIQSMREAAIQPGPPPG